MFLCCIILLLVLYSIKYLWEWETVWYIYSLIISWCLSFGLRINVQHRTQIKYIKLIHICSVIEFIAIVHSLILSRSKTQTLKNFNFDKKKKKIHRRISIKRAECFQFVQHSSPPPLFFFNKYFSLAVKTTYQSKHLY